MVVGSGLIELWIVESRSLKEKRGVLKRILQRTRNAFNVSIAEIGENDSWKRAKVGFCVVGNDTRYINGKVDHILSFIEDLQLAEILDSRIEIVSLSDAMPHVDDSAGKYGLE
ncbi:hypothetical protein SAMN04489760_101154 [Syntrophus gentianae]|uniref:DUF503 domain-containing protein n=1 Tax=Syntrophus gentianae TaxID=43775 RepID=A0A1H7UF28_9BACT|nr:DUF503 domain-containing protein [Syntrophus gentianae]SEL95660.1 hypothetical protein SAMN04489760_101154 [Syntrophus gentianae]